MRKANEIEKEINEIETVEDLTGVFESVSSTAVAKHKNKVALSKEFFDLLWKRYSSIRANPKSYIANRTMTQKNGRNAYVIISAEAGLSGDLDQRLIETMLREYNKDETDIIVLGTHGATQLKQLSIPYVRYFQVPPSDSYIDVSPVIDAIIDYDKVIIFYEEYISLGVQGVKKMDLISSIQTMSDSVDMDEDVMTIDDTIFEPSLEQIASEMEKTMITLAFSQAILESSLAQDASRFNAMAIAKRRALELLLNSKLEFHRSKRAESDRRLHEALISLKKKKRTKAKGRKR